MDVFHIADVYGKVLKGEGNMKKRAGHIKNMIPFFLLLSVLILMSYDMQKRQYHATSTSTEDALAASNLASAMVDIREYGLSHNLVITDTDRAYEIYREALQYNLNLDSNWEHPNKKMISGKVDVVDYIVYSVSGNDVDVSCYGENPYTTSYKDGLGSVTAPNGQKIESTSIYSKITFPVDGIWDIHTIAVKDKLVDVVNEYEEVENENQE